MRILSIETSCDESGIALVEAKGGLTSPSFKVIAEGVASQIETHRPWGGVVPILARREHDKNLPLLFENLKSKIKNLDRLAVTIGPGLDPCLWSGINFALNLQKQYFPKVKVAGANHLEGHIYSFLLSKQKISFSKIFPAIQLLVSGGHTMLVLMNSINEWIKLGETKDDAAGEAFDKVARMLDLPYPGGPEISRLAEMGNDQAVDFPRPMISSKDYYFSFSGLKTAVFYYLRGNKNFKKEDVAASFEKAVIDVLVTKAIRAVEEFGARSLMLSGGVAANKKLRQVFEEKTKEMNVNFLSAPQKYQTDNGVIIAVASYINYLTGKRYKLKSQPNLGL